MEKFLRTAEADGYGSREQWPVESRSQSQAAAERFAGASGRQGKHWSVVLEAPEDAQQDAFKDVSSLVRWLARDSASGGVDVEKSAPVETESEWLLSFGQRFGVASMARDAARRVIRVTLSSLLPSGL